MAAAPPMRSVPGEPAALDHPHPLPADRALRLYKAVPMATGKCVFPLQCLLNKKSIIANHSKKLFIEVKPILPKHFTAAISCRGKLICYILRNARIRSHSALSLTLDLTPRLFFVPHFRCAISRKEQPNVYQFQYSIRRVFCKENKKIPPALTDRGEI